MSEEQKKIEQLVRNIQKFKMQGKWYLENDVFEEFADNVKAQITRLEQRLEEAKATIKDRDTSLRIAAKMYTSEEADNKRLREALIDAIHQACAQSDGKVDSMALSSYANTLRLLAETGDFVIEKEYGRRVIGHWKAELALKGKAKGKE